MLLNNACFDFSLTSASRAFVKNDDIKSVIISNKSGTMRVKTATADSLCSWSAKDVLSRLPSRSDLGLIASGNRQQTPLMTQNINWLTFVDIFPIVRCSDEATCCKLNIPSVESSCITYASINLHTTWTIIVSLCCKWRILCCLPTPSHRPENIHILSDSFGKYLT